MVVDAVVDRLEQSNRSAMIFSFRRVCILNQSALSIHSLRDQHDEYICPQGSEMDV